MEDNNNNIFVTKKIESPIIPLEAQNQIDPNIKNYTQPKQSFFKQNRYYILAIVIGIVIISVLSYFAFKKPANEPTQEAKVKLEIVSPELAPSGSEPVYQIKIENQDTQKLVNMELEITYSSGLSYSNSNIKPSNLSGTLFEIPDMIPGQNAAIVLKTKVTGNINDNKTLTANLRYKFNNFNSTFTKKQESSLRLAASDIILEINGAQSVSNAQIAVYNIKYKNTSNSDIKNARLKIDFPPGFSFASANPLPDISNNIWNIAKLSKDQEGTIELSGSFKDSNPGEAKSFNADFSVQGKDGNYFVQSQASFISGISSLPLLVSQIIENQKENNIVNPGETINLEVRFQNNAAIVASGVNIIMSLDSKAVDLSSLRSEGGQISGNTITWNASGVKSLENLLPSESGSVSMSFTLKNPATKDSSKNLTVISSLKIKSNEYETFFPGNEISLKISSPASLASSLKFDSGTFPPQVGLKTIYKTSLSLKNSSNDIAEGVLTAFITSGSANFIPGSVSSAESSKFEFDQATGKITWKVGNLPAYAGKFNPSRNVDFGLSIIPSASQAGDSPELLTNIKFTGKDSFTGQEVILETENITTDDADTSGNGNGRVVN